LKKGAPVTHKGRIIARPKGAHKARRAPAGVPRPGVSPPPVLCYFKIMETDNKHKYDFLLTLLEEGDAMLCLDARRPDVDVPQAHKADPALNLILNLNFRRPIEIKEEGVYVTLAFGGRPHPCIIPFDAVWAVYEPGMKKIQVWEKSIPEDLDLSGEPLAPKPAAPAPAQKAPPKEKPGKKPAPGKRDRSHLRVIK